MEVTGKIIVVCPVRSGESAKGPWKSQEYVIEWDEPGSQYSRKMVFNVFGDNVDKFKIKEGGTYIVSVDINAREWNGRWFNDIRAWRVLDANQVSQQPLGAPAMPGGMKTPEPFNASQPAADESSDLPF